MKTEIWDGRRGLKRGEMAEQRDSIWPLAGTGNGIPMAWEISRLTW